ncbi:transglycosylase SLT domain-containing protein [Candidatus Binatia bacterium]|nr:transglycosylase SLT domain-containing protein [Candidatus Binatia bacterium]
MPKAVRSVAWLMAAAVCALVAAGQAAARRDVPIPDLPRLRPQVDFWKQVYATYSRNEVAIHDTRKLDRVYVVLDFSDLAASDLSDTDIAAYRKARVESEIERIRALLVGLHQSGGAQADATAEERAVARLFADDPDPARFLKAAAPDRLRSQTGLRERFGTGLETARRYWPTMERVFAREGLPLELTRLPMVESCFNVHAYSKVGAAGIWQFMPATASRFMRVDDVLDERRDPFTATAAAAVYLRRDYEALGSWPLAITAYNHGRAGVQRAVNSVGSTDLQDIVERYDGPAFKFASRNFYAEFLAALEVEREVDRHFPYLAEWPPIRLDAVTLTVPATFASLAAAAEMEPSDLAVINPALGAPVVAGRASVPGGYTLRLPAGRGEAFRRRHAALTERERRERATAARQREETRRASGSAPSRNVRTHRVRSGQTLSEIARRYGTTVEALKRRNGLGKRSTVRAGQTLAIPAG